MALSPPQTDPDKAPSDARFTSAAHWDAVAERWKQAPPQLLWRAYSDRFYRTLLQRWFPPGRAERTLKTDLFDEAYGQGLAPFLADRSQHVTGIDLSPVVLRAAQARHPRLEGVRADIRRLPFPDDWFDVVVSTSTLDHFSTLEDVRRSLHELFRVLQPGGHLLLTLDNAANPIIALRNALPFRLLNRLGLVPYYVGATCGPRRLRKMVRAAGFHVREVDAVLHCPRALAVKASRLLERHARPQTQRRFLRLLERFEALARWPTRFRTGHYVAVRAVKAAQATKPPS